MKILVIRGQNLASLEDEFEINFTQEPLKSAGIFAITGSTGSGKSTLLDALCLSLFDTTPRTYKVSEKIQIQDVSEEKIDHTDCRTLLRRGASEGYAEVEFIALDGEHYCSKWTVRRARNKANGALQKSEIRILNLTNNTEVQGTKTELLAKINALLGLSFDQFTRAVLLAQGDFATFLKAKQSEKADLLEKLTGTEIYSTISKSIYEHTKEAEQNHLQIFNRIKDIELLSQEQMNQYGEEQVSCAKSIEKLKHEIQTLNQKLLWLEQNEKLIQDEKQAEETHLKIQKAVEAAIPRTHYMQEIEKVQEIRDTYNERRNAQTQYATNNTQLIKQEAENTQLGEQLNNLQLETTALEKENQNIDEAREKIEPEIVAARALDIKIAEATKQYEIQNTDIQKLQFAHQKNKEKIADVQNECTLLQEKTTAYNLWFEEHKNYEPLIPRIEFTIRLLNDATQSEAQCNLNKKTLENTHEREKLLLDKLEKEKKEFERLNNLLPSEIAELRSQLKNNTACPVCGSLHHPFSGINKQSLEEKELNLLKSSCTERTTEYTTQLEALKQEVTKLRTQIESYEIQVKSALNTINEHLVAFPQWKEQWSNGTLKQQLEDLAEQWTTNQKRLTENSELISNKKIWIENESAHLVVSTKQLDDLRIQLAETHNQCKQLQERRNKLLNGQDAEETVKHYATLKRNTTTQLKQKTEQRNSTSAQYEKSKGILSQLNQEQERLKTQGVQLKERIVQWTIEKNITENQLADYFSKTPQWIAQEKQELATLTEQETILRTKLSERKESVLKHQEQKTNKADPLETKSNIQELLAENNIKLNQATKQLAEIDLALANNIKNKERIKSFEKELHEKHQLCENWKKLNDLLGSASGNKFKEMAQGYTLDVLLAYANKHLEELTKRYELQRIEETLALQVVDLDMLGEIRAVHSLSGGESFLISLALALGLSSLSSNRMKVESLFIDEGFGSLDPDTLSIALDALEALQSQGRKIGIISHVGEMTERITTKIQVIKMANGKSKVCVN